MFDGTEVDGTLVRVVVAVEGTEVFVIVAGTLVRVAVLAALVAVAEG